MEFKENEKQCKDNDDKRKEVLNVKDFITMYNFEHNTNVKIIWKAG